MKLEKIIEEVKANQDNPVILSKLRLELAGEYMLWSEEAAQIKSQKKPEEWVKLKFKKIDGEWRDKPRSDTITEQLWRTTPIGKREVELKYLMKGAEKELSAIKSRIDVLGNELRNQF